jgi:hypothetical protein
MEEPLMGTTIAIVGVLAAIGAIIAAFVVAKRQERLQRTLEAKQENLAHDLEARQRHFQLMEEGAQACRDISTHLINWHDAVLTAVRNDDAGALNEVEGRIYKFAVIQSQLQGFRALDHFQGPLHYLLIPLEEVPGGMDVIVQVRDFEARALDFKTGIAGKLQEILQVHAYSPGKDDRGALSEQDLEFNQNKIELQSDFEDAYNQTINKLGELMRSLRTKRA